MKTHRNRLGLSQSKLAERVDTATNYIAAIEAERRFPSVEILEKIAFALEIDSPDLFSMKTMQVDIVQQEIREQIWLEVGENLSNFIVKKLAVLKKRRKN
jgi:transcriptional regulator with XRE-family HTH domain